MSVPLVGEKHQFSLNFNWESKHPMHEAVLKAMVPEPEEEPEPAEDPKPRGVVGRDLHSDPEEGDEDDVPMHHVQSDPPPRFEHEEAFSTWLHSHPIHESEQEYEEARAGLGLSKMHSPETTHEDADEEEHSDSTAGGERSTGIDLPRAGEEEPPGDAVPVEAQPQQEETRGLQP